MVSLCQPFDIPYQIQQLLDRKVSIYRSITTNFSLQTANLISKTQKEQMEGNGMTLTYGQIKFESMAQVFETIKARYGGFKQGGVFYDLGSGTGKGALTAALLHQFQVCKGIQILHGLFQISQQLKHTYNDKKNDIINENPDLYSRLPELEFVRGDIFQYDWSDADCIFANSTCFDYQMMDRIAQAPLKPGTKAITFTKNLSSEKWVVLQSIQKTMSWGIATVFMHERVEPNQQIQQSFRRKEKKYKVQMRIYVELFLICV